MEIRLAASAHGMFDTVLRFLPAGTPVSFGDPGLQSAYAACFPGDTLTLEHKQLRCVRMPCQGGFANLLLAGFDSQAAAPFDALRQLAAKAGAALEDFGAASVLIDRLDALTFAPEEEIASQICAVLPLCEYRFDKYLSVRRERPAISAVLLSQRDLTPAIQEGLHLSQAVMTARDLVNEIAETLTPAELARRCEALGRQHGFETEVLDCSNWQGNAVVNYTEREVPYTRIIEHKHFGFGRQPKTVISREYPAEWTPGMEPYYPVNNEKNQALYEAYRRLAEERTDVIFGGRLGSYRYYDMDKVIRAALDAVREELG